MLENLNFILYSVGNRHHWSLGQARDMLIFEFKEKIKPFNHSGHDGKLWEIDLRLGSQFVHLRRYPICANEGKDWETFSIVLLLFLIKVHFF